MGDETARALLKHFKSVTRVKEASVETLSGVVGVAKAKIIVNFYQGDGVAGAEVDDGFIL